MSTAKETKRHVDQYVDTLIGVRKQRSTRTVKIDLERINAAINIDFDEYRQNAIANDGCNLLSSAFLIGVGAQSTLGARHFCPKIM